MTFGSSRLPTFVQNSLGFLDLCHYNLSSLDICHYNSTIWKLAITIHPVTDSCHFIRLSRRRAHLQVLYTYKTFRIAHFTSRHTFSFQSLTYRAHTSSSSSILFSFPNEMRQAASPSVPVQELLPVLAGPLSPCARPSSASTAPLPLPDLCSIEESKVCSSRIHGLNRQNRTWWPRRRGTRCRGYSVHPPRPSPTHFPPVVNGAPPDPSVRPPLRASACRASLDSVARPQTIDKHGDVGNGHWEARDLGIGGRGLICYNSGEHRLPRRRWR